MTGSQTSFASWELLNDLIYKNLFCYLIYDVHVGNLACDATICKIYEST